MRRAPHKRTPKFDWKAHRFLIMTKRPVKNSRSRCNVICVTGYQSFHTYKYKYLQHYQLVILQTHRCWLCFEVIRSSVVALGWRVYVTVSIVLRMTILTCIRTDMLWDHLYRISKYLNALPTVICFNPLFSRGVSGNEIIMSMLSVLAIAEFRKEILPLVTC